MKGITKIITVEDLGNTPAKVNRLTGEMYISKRHFSKMPPIYRKFVLFHEEGHVKLNTTSEEAADNYAVDELIKRGYPLSEILKSLTKVLTFNNKEHYGRAMVVFNKLREHDYKVNGNTKVLSQKIQNQMETPAINVYDQQFDYESNAIGAILGAAGGIMSGVGAVTNALGIGGGGGGGGSNPVKLAVEEAVRTGTFAANRSKIIQLASTLGVGAAKVDFWAAQASGGGSTPEPNPANPASGGFAPAQVAPSQQVPAANKSFMQEHKTKIIIAVVVVIVIAVALWWYKNKKGK